MTTFRLTQIIDRPVDEVFDAVIHVDEFPQWNAANRSARKITSGPIGGGTQFELEIRGFGLVLQELQEFVPNRQVRLVPTFRVLTGGHRFVFTPQGASTRIDHELEMKPSGIFKLMAPIIWMTGKKNLRDTAGALKRYIESRTGAPSTE